VTKNTELDAIRAYQKRSIAKSGAESVAPTNSGVTKKVLEKTLSKLSKSPFKVAGTIRSLRTP
jgi:hypothetical protein